MALNLLAHQFWKLPLLLKKTTIKLLNLNGILWLSWDPKILIKMHLKEKIKRELLLDLDV